MPSVNLYAAQFSTDLEKILPDFRQFVAELLSTEERFLRSDEISLRLCKIEPASLQIAPLEIEIAAYAHPDRVLNQNQICIAVVDFLCAALEGLDKKCHVWIKLSEMGHSWDDRKPITLKVCK